MLGSILLVALMAAGCGDDATPSGGLTDMADAGTGDVSGADSMIGDASSDGSPDSGVGDVVDRGGDFGDDTDPGIDPEGAIGPIDQPDTELSPDPPPAPLASWMYLLADPDLSEAIASPSPAETAGDVFTLAGELSTAGVGLYLGVIPTNVAEAPLTFDLVPTADRTVELLADPHFYPAADEDSYSGVDLLVFDPFDECPLWHIEGLDVAAVSDLLGGDTSAASCVDVLFFDIPSPSGIPPVVFEAGDEIPEGFKPVDGRPNLVEPDGSDLEAGDPIGSLRFWKDAETIPQLSDDFDDADLSRRDAPVRATLSDHVTVWWQAVPVHNHRNTADGPLYRGGEYRIQLKSTSPCENGRWIQLYRQTLRLGTSPDDLKEGYIDEDLGIAMPYETEPEEPEDGGWTVDRADGGGPDHDPHYRWQHEGEMIDSPERGFSSLQGFYSSRTPPRTPAMVIQKLVELVAFFVDDEGNVCDIVTYSFVTTWQKPNETTNDPLEARITTEFEAPTLVDTNGDEGRALIDQMDTTVERFRNP